VLKSFHTKSNGANSSAFYKVYCEVIQVPQPAHLNR